MLTNKNNLAIMNLQSNERGKTKMNNTKGYLDFTTLNEIEEDIKIAQDTLKNVLTTSQKNAILYLMANNVSKILKIYTDVNKRRIDYPNKKVYLNDTTTIDLKFYDEFIKRLTKAYTTIVDIQKEILGENVYNKIVYAI